MNMYPHEQQPKGHGFIRLTGSSGRRMLIALRYIVSFESRHGHEEARTTVVVRAGRDTERVYAVIESVDAIEMQLEQL
jgi:hypothetical protein